MEKVQQKVLKPRQERFCQEYIKDKNTQAAYLRAGYRSGNAESNAYRLLKHPLVQARIKELQDFISLEARPTIERMIEKLMLIAEQAEGEGKWAAATRAYELVGKYLGMFTEHAAIEITERRTKEQIDEDIVRLRKLVDDND